MANGGQFNRAFELPNLVLRVPQTVAAGKCLRRRQVTIATDRSEAGSLLQKIRYQRYRRGLRARCRRDGFLPVHSQFLAAISTHYHCFSR